MHIRNWKIGKGSRFEGSKKVDIETSAPSKKQKTFKSTKPTWLSDFIYKKCIVILHFVSYFVI